MHLQTSKSWWEKGKPKSNSGEKGIGSIAVLWMVFQEEKKTDKKQALIWRMILCFWKRCTAIYWIFLINSKANVHAFVMYLTFSGISNSVCCFLFVCFSFVSPSFGLGFYTEHWNIKVTAEQRWNSSTHFNAKQKWIQAVASGHRHDPYSDFWNGFCVTWTK